MECVSLPKSSFKLRLKIFEYIFNRKTNKHTWFPKTCAQPLVEMWLNSEQVSFVLIKNRSSRREMFCKNGVLRHLTKLTGKHLCQSLFFNKEKLWHRCFPVNFVKFLRTPLYIAHLWWLLLKKEVKKVQKGTSVNTKKLATKTYIRNFIILYIYFNSKKWY